MSVLDSLLIIVSLSILAILGFLTVSERLGQSHWNKIYTGITKKRLGRSNVTKIIVDICCNEKSVKCLACKANITEQQFCNLYKRKFDCSYLKTPESKYLSQRKKSLNYINGTKFYILNTIITNGRKS